MIVYRVEGREETHGMQHPNVGRGAYRAGLAHYICSNSNDSRHPRPQEEDKLADIFDYTYVCCFTSIRDLHRWFDEIDSCPDNVAEELQIATYAVPDEYFHNGRWQSIAHMDHMRRVEVHPIHYRAED